jgi:hypothetical protein
MTSSAQSFAEAERKEEARKRIAVLDAHRLIPQGTQEWLQARRVLITASEVASFLTHDETCAGEYVKEFGLEGTWKYSGRCASPYDSGKQLIKRKRGVTGPMNGDNPFFNHGHLFEPVARNLYRKLNDMVEVKEYGLITSQTIPWLGGSADGVSADGVILEIKSPLVRDISGNTAIPFHYWIQCEILMQVLQLPRVSKSDT